MERTQLFDLMSELKLYGMKAAYDEIMATAVKRQHEPQRIVGDLLNAEINEKQARSIKYQLTIAKLPLAKDLDDFHFEGTPINQTLGHVETVTGRMAGQYGLLQGVLGSPEEARKVVKALDRADTLLASLNGVSLKVDGVLGKVDHRLFDRQGVMDQAQQAIVHVNAILGDARESLKKADAILANAQTASKDVAKITGDVAEATTDMARLRLEIDDSVRKVNHLINEINKKWPFARDVEIKTP